MITKSSKDYSSLTLQNITNTSRIQMYNILYDTELKEYFLNIFKSYIVSEDNLNTEQLFYYHTVEDEDWLDTISYKYYDTPGLWWLVCIPNKMVNPFEGLVVGDIIKVLKEKYLYIIFTDMKRISRL